ncbi:MAG: hypothetical protein ACI9KE_005867 [Polyangiales bacterium]|jgi:hypothetical protein
MRWLTFILIIVACSGEEPAVPSPEPEPAIAPPEEASELPEGAVPPSITDEGAEGLRAPQRPGMTRAEWTARFVPGYLEVSCRDGFFFRECFTDVDRPDCELEMTRHIAACVADSTVDIPAQITSAELSRQATLRVGRCAGTRYEEALMDAGTFVDSDLCNDPSNWTGPSE